MTWSQPAHGTADASARLKWSLSAGVRAPADMSVVGFDDIPLAAWRESTAPPSR